jgi:very-short-patch-repair endonuclease
MSAPSDSVLVGDAMRAHAKTTFARRLRKSMTHAEVLLWSKLRRANLGHRFRKQHPIGPYIADFACIEARLVVEVDGATHATDDEVAYDRQRTRFIEAGGWRVVRVWNGDVTDNLAGAIEFIADALVEQVETLKGC